MKELRVPEVIWVIFDPLDGPHYFKSEKAARKTYKKWGKEAENRLSDSFWDMSEPEEYRRTKDL